MPRIEYRPSRSASPRQIPRSLTLLCRVLLALALGLGLVIAAGTVYALAIRPKSAPAAPSASGTPSPASPDTAVFTGLGRLRCPTAGPAPATVILQAVFPYFPGDRPFSEELVSRIRDFRSLTAAYFNALSPEELRIKGEEEVKAELLEQYNALLRLGQITTLYFNEFMLLD
jgi:flagellar basal body-associated protein FliL